MTRGDGQDMSDNFANAIAALAGSVERIESRVVTELAAMKKELLTTRSEIMDRIDRLQDTLTNTRDGEIVTLGTAERAEKIARDARDSAREEMATFARQIGGLARQMHMVLTRLDHLESGR